PHDIGRSVLGHRTSGSGNSLYFNKQAELYSVSSLAWSSGETANCRTWGIARQRKFGALHFAHRALWTATTLALAAASGLPMTRLTVRSERRRIGRGVNDHGDTYRTGRYSQRGVASRSTGCQNTLSEHGAC